MEPADLPLGGVGRALPVGPALCVGALALVATTALLELSRTLAETYRGRWFAGNGRDLFHGAALACIACAFLVAGFAPPLAGVASAAVLIAPLARLDALHGGRGRRVAVLLGLLGAPLLPALLAPARVGEGLNALARALFG